MMRGIAVCAIGLIVALMGCAGKKRPFADDPLGDDSAVDPDSLEGPGPGVQIEIAALSPGEACQQGTDCATGNCVDGVCCDSPCTELCAACNQPGSLGVCSAAASDPLCPDANCRGQSSECRPLGSAQATLNCDAVGVCRATAECAALPAPAGMPCQEDTGTCDGQGACRVPDKNSLGEPCEIDDNCAEGHCVAGAPEGARICCDAACDGVCQACSPAGRCEDTPLTDARCEAVTCPVDNVCRDYAEVITDNLCRSFGQCRSAVDCVTPAFFTGLRPDAQCVCEPASGDCALAASTACEQDGDCASGACVSTAQGNRLCCSGACAAGLFCSSTGGGCVQCEGSQVACDGNVQRTCSAGAIMTTTCRNGCTPGTGCNNLPPVGFLCDAGRCASGGVCQQDTGGQTRCCVRNCAAEGKVCSPNGSCECPPGQVASGNGCLFEPGDPCQSGAQCQTGLSCVDGVCCREACGGYCERCQTGTGMCVAVPAGQQEADPVSGNNCTNGFECTGTRNGCRARTGQSCSSNDGSDCVSGNCEATAGGARVCCSQNCSGVRDSCRGSGQGCVECESAAECGNGCNVAQGTCNALRAPGETCSVAGQCATNRCVPASDNANLSRCCANCAQGQVCTPQGQCVNRQSELGGSCTSNANCRVGVCVGGICCSSACDPACESCGGNGVCQSNGACDAFDCTAPNPPAVSPLAESQEFTFFDATPPPPNGGTIREGRYVATRRDTYGGVRGEVFFLTFEFRSRSVQIGYLQANPPLPEIQLAGRFATSGTSLQLDLDNCDPDFNPSAFDTVVPTMQYTATANGLALFYQRQGVTVVTAYALQ